MSLSCYQCGAPLDDLSLPLRRLEECPACSRHLHVCLMCTFYDPNETSKQCTEDDAEEVKDKASANFCDYFEPRAGAFDPARLAASENAAKQLEALFGDSPEGEQASGTEQPDSTLTEAEALFRK